MKYKFILEIDIPEKDKDKLLCGTVGEWIHQSISDTYEEIYDWVPGDETISVKEMRD